MTDNFNPAGKQWTDIDKQQWFEQQTIKRSYQDEVVSQITLLSSHFEVVQYHQLLVAAQQYPVFALKSKHWQTTRKTILVTGGVHGYETSGVQGALRFLQNEMEPSGRHYHQHFNIVVVPCVSPWGYETINRWNHQTLDPNRCFYSNSPAQESKSLMDFIDSLGVELYAHIDLHETTDTDNTVFRPALSARDAIEQKTWNIPDGFYLVANALKPQDKFQQAIIRGVEKVTHIAPADESNRLIGEPLAQYGVINYAARELGLCMGFTNAPYATTTEVYPDSPKVNDENCTLAQVAAIHAALDYLLPLQ